MSHPLTYKSLARQRLHAACSILISIAISASAAFGSVPTASQDSGVFGKCWEVAVNSNLVTGPAADASAVYILDENNKLRAVDLATGNNAWSSEVGGELISNLLVLDDSIFFLTTSQSDIPNSSPKTLVRALSRQTGITIWQAETKSSKLGWLGPVNGSVVAVSSDGSVSAFTRADGVPVWKIELASGITSDPHFQPSGIELGTENREVVRISGSTGGVQAVWKSEYLPTAVITDASGRLVVGDDRGSLMLVAPGGSRVWRFRNGAQISSVLLHDSEYLAASYDNFVYKLSRGGNVKWKRRLSGRAADAPIVLGDTAIVSIVGTGTVYALNLNNGKISNRIESGDEVSLRVAGSADAHGFIVSGPRTLTYFSSKCSSK